jgi:type I restriction enzyme S subunit
VAVKPGYKQTEVGVIPEDWDLFRLEELCTRIIDGTHFTPHYVGDGVQFYSVENVTADDFTNTKFITRAEHDRLSARCRVARGDILLTRIGSLGATKIIDWDVDASIYVSLALLKPKSAGLGEYVCAYTKSRRFVQDVEARSLLNAAPKKINLGDIGSVPVAVPPQPSEQRAIAEALGVADDLIESLEQILAKKRWVKQGAMQELLSGKKRLPGFSGKWELKQLGDCFALVTTRNAELNDNVVTISAQRGFVRQEEFFKKRVASSVLENYYLIERGHFAYNRSYSNGYPFGAIKRLTRYDKGVVTSLYICFALKPEAESDPTFFEQYFEAGLLNSGLSTVTNEGGRAHGLLNINKADFFSREIKRPPLPEQTAVAAILCDMDAEIAALEDKLGKARELKHGMMQELLTGRIRLV